MSTKIDSADTTGNTGIEFNDTIQGKTSADTFSLRIKNAQEENLSEFTPNWSKWKGYYDSVAELQSIIDKKAMWAVGKGYEADKTTKNKLDKIAGFGKDSFTMIMSNMIRMYTTCGDAFAEICNDRNGKLVNLKPLNPGTIKILGNKKGILTGYEQWINGKKANEFKPEKLLHLPWTRFGDAIHGTGTIEKLDDIILMRKEAMADMKTVFHRYVKPLLIVSVDTDDPTEIEAFKAKLNKTMEQSENLIVPKQTVDSIERMSIPQYSTLDPLPWINMLMEQFILAEGVPAIILGAGKETTEATSKMLYLAFQQMVEWNQLFVQECLKAQLGIDIKFNFPANIAPDIAEGESKSKKTNNMEVGTGQNTGG